MAEDYVEIDGQQWPLKTVKCCREWQVSPMAKVGPCGICGEVPK